MADQPLLIDDENEITPRGIVTEVLVIENVGFIVNAVTEANAYQEVNLFTEVNVTMSSK